MIRLKFLYLGLCLASTCRVPGAAVQAEELDPHVLALVDEMDFLLPEKRYGSKRDLSR